jgi:hypothetical protein
MTKITELSRDSSGSFTEDLEESRVRKFAKHMLKSSLFIGTFLEKRFVEPLDSYRAVIKVGDDEAEFIENLISVKKRCVKFFPKNVWVGITEPKTIGAPAGYNLWVSLNEEVFGSYWYKVKNVEFFFNEVRLKLEVVRPISKEKTPVHNITPKEVFEEASQSEIKEFRTRISAFFKEKLNELFGETLTWPNIKQAVIFIFLLLSTLITFLIEAIKYLLEYFLKLLHETSGLVKVCTPIIISFMKLVMNTINGLYNLIAMMWRDRSPPKINQNLYQFSPYQVPYYNNLRALPQSYEGPNLDNYRYGRPHRSSVKITPLD